MRRAPGELKHLSTPRNRQHPRSSGERNGVSPNHGRGKAAAVAVVGLKGALRGDCRPPRAPHPCDEADWKAAPQSVTAA